MQEALFELEHVHEYEQWHGPIKVNGVIQAGTDKWCWTCGSWVDHTPEGRELGSWSDRTDYADKLAIDIKRSILTRNDAINSYRARFQRNYGDSVTSIDIAIGNLNEGVAE